MKLPWDRNYLKIALHVIFALVASYILISIVDGAAFIVVELRAVLASIFIGIRNILSLFSPLIISFLIAYLFDPIVVFFQKQYNKLKNNIIMPWLKVNINYFKNKKQIKKSQFEKRFVGTLLTYLSIFLGVFLIVRLVATSFSIGDIATITTNTVNTLTIFTENLVIFIEESELGFLDPIIDYISSFLGFAVSWITDAIPTIFAGVIATGAGILDFLISIVVAFYFMVHKERILYQIKSLSNILVPKKINRILSVFLDDLHFVFSGYIRGLVLDGIILGSLIGIALSLPFINAELAIPIAILTAIFNMIPYFGGIMAFILSVISELILGTPTTALYAAIAIIVIQQIDSIFIVPRVVGQNVKLSAPVVILSLSIAGSLFGIWGMVLIVPTMAIIKIFAIRFIERYRLNKINKKRKD
ncbi:MAG: AI-2E family transporter [Defluviitaleaceae bacterium]|nr:AI-2E family transporter [Defluviitaleaceae bacterium]